MKEKALDPISNLKIALAVTAFASAGFAAVAQDGVWTIAWFILGSLRLYQLRVKTEPPSKLDYWLLRFTTGFMAGAAFCWLVAYSMGQPEGYRVWMCLAGLVYLILRLVEDSKASKEKTP